ncbi:MAG: hypothetical protein IJT27_03905 [Clostridia bacterium]|nr:hypothetical protein [Clostridia bacterium]
MDTLKKHVKAKRYAPRMFSSEATLFSVRRSRVPAAYRKALPLPPLPPLHPVLRILRGGRIHPLPAAVTAAEAESFEFCVIRRKRDFPAPRFQFRIEGFSRFINVKNGVVAFRCNKAFSSPDRRTWVRRGRKEV